MRNKSPTPQRSKHEPSPLLIIVQEDATDLDAVDLKGLAQILVHDISIPTGKVEHARRTCIETSSTGRGGVLAECR